MGLIDVIHLNWILNSAVNLEKINIVIGSELADDEDPATWLALESMFARRTSLRFVGYSLYSFDNFHKSALLAFHYGLVDMKDRRRDTFNMNCIYGSDPNW